MYTENVWKMYGIRKIIIIILKRYMLIPHKRYGICNILKRYFLIPHIRHGIGIEFATC
jgi:hypothetical protein